MPRRNRIITIERPLDVRDAQGGVKRSWVVLEEVWASYRPIKADEQFRRGSNRRQAIRVVDFGIRHRDDVDETMRVIYEGLAYGIIGIKAVGRSELILQCERRAG